MPTITITSADGAQVVTTLPEYSQTAELQHHDSFSRVLAKEQGKTITTDYDSLFEKAARTYQVDANLLKAVAKQESNFSPNVTSHSGAMGLMQLMPATAKYLGVTNAYDPEQNIMGGAKLLSEFLQKYNGNTALALAAYNAGPNAVDKAGGIPSYGGVSSYVNKVLGYYQNGVSVPDTPVSVAVQGGDTVTSERDKKWNKILSKIPSNDIHLVSNTEETRSSESTTKTATSKTSAGQASDNSSDDTYSYKDFLDYANDYINIAAAQSTPSSSSLDTTTSLTSNTALLTTLSKLLSSQKS